MRINNPNYEVRMERRVEGLHSDAVLLRHKKTGARVFLLANEDDNKVFSIGFRTPPEDSTGVAHIMEHSTLCGSEKYPLKDPFVELAKGSLNTFLNAMTYPDKTVYPVASRNDQDFRNLMSVYMDAVFHPNIYKHPEIMRQEGWSYKLESEDAPIEYNGVVYNEMKGAFSAPDSVLERETVNSLFPDTTYGVESGGDPDHIPELTYDAFLDFHRRYYHPSNCYIYLYGDMDFEERLAWMDEEYLGKYDYLEIDSAVRRQEPFKEMRVVRKDYPITDDESEQDNTYLSYNLVCGDNLDAKQYIAMQMLVYALVDTQGAPIRQRLLDEGIGKDIMPVYDNGLLQPYFSIAAKNANADQKDRFLEIIREELKKAADEGVDRKSLTAELNTLKFKYKEADFGGAPKGLIYGLSCLDSWLYDEEKPLLHIDSNGVLDELEKDIGSGYYEELIRKYLLDNPHSSLIILTPKKGLAAEKAARTAEKLAQFKASLSEEQIRQMVADTKALAAYQETESTKEELETIPLLKREDIKREPEGPRNDLRAAAGMPYVVHDYETNGIAYVTIYFDANDVGRELFPYLGLLKSVVSFVDTEKYTFSELNNEINTVCGGFAMDAGIYTDRIDPSVYSVRTVLSFKAFYENIGRAFDLAEEVLFTGRYHDGKRLYEIIAELKSKLQMTLMSSGNVAAALRAASYYSEAMALREQISGIGFYKFVENLEKNFDAEKERLIANLEKLLKIIIRSGRVMVGCTAEADGAAAVAKRLEAFRTKLDAFSGTEESDEAEDAKTLACTFRDRRYDFAGNGFVLEQKNEAFRTSGSVNYLARAGIFLDDGRDYTGAVNVFHSIMNYEYMWFNIRVQGGAYGCMCNGTVNGSTYFVTYRDPNIRRSNDVFEGIPEYLEQFDCDDREMTKFVIGTMSSVDTPLTPSLKGARDMAIFLSRADYEDMKRARAEIIDCTQEDIRALSAKMRRALDGGHICCVGAETKIEEDKDLFKEVRNLFE